MSHSDDTLSAEHAMDYAIDREYLALFGVLLAGGVVSMMGQYYYQSYNPRALELLFGVPLILLGSIIVFLSLIAVAHKLLVDTLT